ncbi:hypothetical protein [Desulfitobacterium sp.]|uniref:hypothetical protein n=1 Tax=Desulfitobacterium sp. TaxID=49981 RepID=UPI002B1F91DD|nr:hypothetical protein [Desulfitobacterium sp.]MEA4902230.1 hypothetical protein [Desulfitobacterium sp.]
MSSLLKDPFSQGILIVALNAWASLMFLISLGKSYVAGNSLWVSIFIGLISISCAISVHVWKALILEKKEVVANHGEPEPESE